MWRGSQADVASATCPLFTLDKAPDRLRLRSLYVNGHNKSNSQGCCEEYMRMYVKYFAQCLVCSKL